MVYTCVFHEFVEVSFFLGWNLGIIPQFFEVTIGMAISAWRVGAVESGPS